MLCNLHKAVFDGHRKLRPGPRLPKYLNHGAEWQPDDIYDTHSTLPRYLESHLIVQRQVAIPKCYLFTASTPHQNRLSLQCDVKPQFHSHLDHRAIL
jgi:hypothetical protein